ncbi:MAG: hypothetical protein HRU24_13340 [Gammaproteobacteria bacterium]|nr:hypothetical protein [Gammaproteobacteria bacterium]
MLQFDISKRNGGFILWGDYGTLKPLHSYIMDIANNSPVLDSEGIVVALAYDIRKAYEGQREKSTTTVWDDEITIYGVEQVWTTFLMQVALLRYALAFVDSSKNDQCQIYLLEDFTEQILQAAFPKESHDILAQYKQLIGIQESFIEQKLGSRSSYFLTLNKTQRKLQLAEILSSLQPMWDVITRTLDSDRKHGVLNPDELESYSWNSMDNFSDEKFQI